jgi:hypothetical protein
MSAEVKSLILETNLKTIDDLLVICWLASCKEANLKAVILSPGSKNQLFLTRFILDRCHAVSVPIGSMLPPKERDIGDYAAWHSDIFKEHGRPLSYGTVYGSTPLTRALCGKETTYLSLCAPKALYTALPYIEELDTLISLRGFPGDNLSSVLHCLPDMRQGKQLTLSLLSSDKINKKLLIGKHEDPDALQKITCLMDVYKRTPRQKNMWRTLVDVCTTHGGGTTLLSKFLGATTALDHDVCDYNLCLDWECGGKYARGVETYVARTFNANLLRCVLLSN